MIINPLFRIVEFELSEANFCTWLPIELEIAKEIKEY